MDLYSRVSSISSSLNENKDSANSYVGRGVAYQVRGPTLNPQQQVELTGCGGTRIKLPTEEVETKA